MAGNSKSRTRRGSRKSSTVGSLADTEAWGNPHDYMDPLCRAAAARALARRLAALDPPHAAQYTANAEAFAKAAGDRVPGWRQRAAAAVPLDEVETGMPRPAFCMRMALMHAVAPCPAPAFERARARVNFTPS
jgi:hypothetical protein